MISRTDTYLTISHPSTGIFKDKGSKFLSFAYPVSNDKDIKEIVEKLKKQYFDARHHCYAYRLGAERLTFRANDDGEPSGTAGKPILGQIDSRGLTNVLIVVVRYFGGILLGTGGLINAYRNASADALSNASVIQKYVHAVYKLTFSYDQMNNVMKVIKDSDLEAFEQNFELTCSMKIRMKLSVEEAILAKLSLMNEVKTELLGIE
ncbi:MAG TPA: YigZ family protein [Bacteroidales bacterium]